MKRLYLFLVFVVLTQATFGQGMDLRGSWKGSLDIMGQKLPLIFHFENRDDGWTGTTDSPTQGAKGMKLKNVLFDGLMLSVEFERIPAIFEGVFVADTIKGTFTQSGSSFPLELARLEEGEALGMEKWQEPKPPFDYEIIETTFMNEREGIKLVGTITKPLGQGPFPAVVLVTGSGPQNRNGEIFGHQPFWVMADFLAKNGIAVLRYDERGVGESEGIFIQATSIDFKEDAASAWAHLKKHPFVNQLKVGILGHSEGGMLGWMLASENQKVNYLIALAAPVVPIHELMVQQTADVLSAIGAKQEDIDKQLLMNDKVYQTIKNMERYEDLEEGLQEMVKKHLVEIGIGPENLEAEVAAIMEAYSPTLSPWFFEFLKFSSEPFIEKIQIPVFAGFGEKDIQVNHTINVEALERIVLENKLDQFKVSVYPGLNHLFQKAESGAISEYGTLSDTFNEQVLKDIADWIKSL